MAEILLQHERLDDATVALEAAGFTYRHAKGVDMFMDGPDAKARDAVRVVFAGEMVREEYTAPVPTLDTLERPKGFATLPLEDLVRMKLTSYRDKDRTHLRDMLDVGLIDATWFGRYPEALAERLQALIDDPEG